METSARGVHGSVKSMLLISPLEQRRSVGAFETVDTRVKLCHAWTLPRVDADASWSCQ